MSQTALSTVSSAASPLVTGAKNTIGAASKNTSEFWQSSRAKVISDKMSEDLRDYARHATGSEGLCSRCESFPIQSSQSTSLDQTITFITPLERVLYHSNWCRLCGYFLRILCRPEHDPFQHPQIAQYLQPTLKGKPFSHFVESGLWFSDANWPFGYGKEQHEGAFNYLDPIAVKHRYKRQAVIASTHLIPMMISVANNPNRTTGYTSAQHRERRKRLQDAKKRQYNKETAYENLVHARECFLEVTIRTSMDSLRAGQVNVSLFGYGRGFGAQLTPISTFNLRTDAEQDMSTTLLRYGKVLHPKQIDLSLGATWLHNCEVHHGANCSEQSWSSVVQAPPSLNVIDVRDNYIVAASTVHDFRFAALSYVWGNPDFETLKLTSLNRWQLTQKNGLREFWHAIPTTIKDAIAVVRAVGERYLWVDALCIVQDVNDEEKHSQIGAMDWLYSKALFTIVAAQSRDSMGGLNGARPGSRDLRQDKVQLRSTHLLTPIKAPQGLDTSVWNSRAWTFQERLLSRRLLIFHGDQMIWHCRSMVAHEDMVAADKGVTYPPLRWLTLRKQLLGSEGKVDGSIMVFPDQTTHIVRSETFKQYAQLVEQYTHRQLTNDGDILNALGGLLHILRQFFRFPMRYGLPEILFDVALLWQPTERLQRRTSKEPDASTFPSWSWAGWKGRVRYEDPFYAGVDQLLGTLSRGKLTEDEYRREERVRPLVQWHIKHRTKNELVPLNKSGLGVPLFSKGKSLPDEWEKDPFPSIPMNERPSSLQISDLSSAMSKILKGHHLIFWTACVDTFRLGKLTPQDSDARLNPKNPPLRHIILDGGSKIVGTLLLDGDGPSSLQEKHEFLVISEAQYYGLDFEPGKIEGYPLYNVMLVEWNEKRSAARRLGMGRVNKGDWRRAGPRVKVICLE